MRLLFGTGITLLAVCSAAEANDPRSASPPERPAPLRDVPAPVDQEAEREWQDRVRRLPEIWPGGTYVMTDGRLKLERKHERVEHEGRAALRLTERMTVKTKGDGEQTATVTYLCRPDKYLTPIRVTMAKGDERPSLDLTFERGRAFGTSKGQKVERNLPARFVLKGLMTQWIALMPWTPGAREEVTTLSPTSFEVRKMEVVCEGPIEAAVNRKKQRIWTFLTRQPDAVDPHETQELYLFTEQRKPQKYVAGATPMAELVPEE